MGFWQLNKAPPPPHGPVNIIDYGADPTGVSDSRPALASALATGRPVYAPEGIYLLNSAPPKLASNTKIFGDGDDLTVFRCAAVEGFGCYNGGNDDIVNVTLSDFTVEQTTNWGGNNFTAVDFTNVSYSRIERVKTKYFLYGVFMRRTATARQCYFNFVNRVKTFGCSTGYYLQDAGNTPNKHSFIQCMSEDNGQRSGGLGLDLSGVGHTVFDFYGGLPGGLAAMRMRLSCQHLNAQLIYGESSTLTQVILDDSENRENFVGGVHGDGLSTLVNVTVPSTNKTVYITAGAASNLVPA
ncbi:glycoside hydrolase family 55 protein [Bradyrhizobium sp. 23]|uniref:glycoside hydrolase family 55 protein n=1 Tax=Bradyrhizobium sp. 23 TaxID=2782667 RepID=UPI001FF988E5|nr:glycoside hydrolase family 55 protein [Bradyrhizobium sp. 23]MCK1317190.1 hypothetical protein [Bradyrhizobium sp. 23]